MTQGTKESPQFTLQDLEALIERAAERGANAVLVRLGLEDNQAIHDVREMRSAIGIFREMRRKFVMLLLQVVTIGLIGLIVVGAGKKLSGGE